MAKKAENIILPSDEHEADRKYKASPEDAGEAGGKKSRKRKRRVKKARRTRRSIRSRLMFLLVIMGIVPAAVVEMVTIHSYESRAIEQRTVTVRSQCDALADQLATRDYINNQDDDVINPEFDMLTSIYQGRIVVMNRDGKIIKDTYNLDTGKYSLSEEVQQCLRGSETSHYDDENQFIEIAMMITNPSNTNNTDIQGVLLISVSTSEIHANTVALEQQGLMMMAVVIILILILGYILSSVLVKPLLKITSAIEGIEVGYEDEKISWETGKVRTPSGHKKSSKRRVHF